MSHSLVLDTLAYANRLKAVGVPDEQAEVQAEALAEIVTDNVATKRDLKELELAMKRDLKELELATERDLKELELRMTIKLGGIMLSGVSLLVVLMKLFKL